MKYSLILNNIAKHINLTKAEQERFTSLLVSKSVAKKEFILREGEVCKYETFVVKGCLRAYTIDDKGVDHVAIFAIEGWWISDLYSFISQNPANYYIDALEDSDILQISKDDLEKVYKKIPKFERFMRIAFQNFIVAQLNRLDECISLTAEQRYKNFITAYPKLEQRLSQIQIASYLGVTPVFLSMIRKKISRRKLIKLL